VPGGCQLAQDRLLDGREVGAAELVLDAAGRRRIPRQPQGVVHGNQRIAHKAAVSHHDHDPEVGASGDDPLSDPDQLRAPRRVDAPRPGAVLARHLAHPGVDAEPAQRGRAGLGEPLESSVGTGGGPRVGNRLREGDRPLVIQGGLPAGQADDGLKAGLPGRAHGGTEPVRGGVPPPEREHAAGAMQAHRRR
jgi:hypothetical protein